MEQTEESAFQCVVISLKEEFYSHADALVGIYSEVCTYVPFMLDILLGLLGICLLSSPCCV